MSGNVLILGANGRFGRAASDAFAARGWAVTEVARSGESRPGRRRVILDARDPSALCSVASGAAVIVNALNSPYHNWVEDVPVMTRAVLAAARQSGATILLPGNLYNYGTRMPETLNALSPKTPDTRKGQIRETLEETYRTSGVPTIVLRSGDFFDGRDSGNWLETHMLKRISRGRVLYPGRLDATHAWAWLPDVAIAAAMLAERRDALPQFAEVLFPGNDLTGQELLDALERVAGRPLRVQRAPWGVMRLISLVSPLMREVLEMRYFWDTPHGIDGGAFKALLPDFVATPLDDSLRETLCGLNAFASDKVQIPSTVAV